jgi:hypothetical protein
LKSFILNVGRAEFLSYLFQVLSNKDSITGAEIGVFNAQTSTELMQILPELKLYMIDPWKEFSKEEYDDASNHCQKIQDARYYLSKAIAEVYGGEVIRKTSAEALNEFSNESIDFVYIDANHEFNHITEDLRGWWGKIKKGGILAGHDYSAFHLDVIRAVNNFVDHNADDIENVIVYNRDNIYTISKGLT